MDSSLAILSPTIVSNARENEMRTVTIDELDGMSDDEFYVFVGRARGIVLEVSTEQRDLMVTAHGDWVETLNEELREDVDWDTATHSNWDLYAELRINGAEFQRARSLALA